MPESLGNPEPADQTASGCEEARLRALLDFDVLDTPPEHSIDRVTVLAARLFSVPIALVSLVEQSRQWFKSCVGLEARETPRELAFCNYTIQSDDVMVVPDATRDPRFAANPLVTGAPHIRFYAGAPLIASGGFRLGTLCVIDTRPREDFDVEQQRSLADLAAIVMRELEFRQHEKKRWKVEQALSDRKKHFQHLADTVPGVVYQWFERADGDRGFNYVSPRVAEFFGLDPDELLKDWSNFIIHPHDLPRWTQTIAEATRDHKDWFFEGRLILPTGDIRWWRGLSKPLQGERPGETLFNGIILDITEERRHKAERQRQYRQLQDSHATLQRQKAQLQTLAAELTAARDAAEVASHAKSEFLASVSHELRTPLTAILGFTDLMLDGRTPIADMQHYLRIQHEAGTTLLALINDILDLSKIEAGRLDLEQVDYSPRATADSCAAIIETLARDKGLELRLDLDAALPSAISGDPTRLQQVLLNLLSNAVKFTSHGHVAMSVRCVEPGCIRFEVADTGVGIAATALPRLFEHFSQADASITRRFGGTGLGLAISQQLVRMMGGEIRVESEPGRGSRFWFDLEILESDETGPMSEQAPIAPPVDRPAHILVAEDVKMNQVLIHALLLARGHSVDFVDNGADAVQASAKGEYDLILMDMQMPDMDGMSATRHIRAREGAGPHIPIIALTANAMAEDVHRCLEAGMDAHVAKPIDRNQLYAAIDRMLNRPGAPAHSVPDSLAAMPERPASPQEKLLAGHGMAPAKQA